MNILVTGGAGYIGSHVVHGLKSLGYTPIILDNLTRGHRQTAKLVGAELIVGDVGDTVLLNDIFRNRSISAVMHFAALAYVGESVENPGAYYQNNVGQTVNLLVSMKNAGVDKFIFSSTCATYGSPKVFPIMEDAVQIPINPYGHSKLMIERILYDFEIAYGLRYVIFRYFNAAGADPSSLIGEWHEPETHLVPLLLQSCKSPDKPFRVFGADYPTPDGSCIRDFVHVSDIAQAHVLGLEHLIAGKSSEVFNLGTGVGQSVFQMIDIVKKITRLSVSIEVGPRRMGDPPELFASAEKAHNILNWHPTRSSPEVIVADAWNYFCKNFDLNTNCNY